MATRCQPGQHFTLGMSGSTHRSPFLCGLPDPSTSPMSVLNYRCLGSTLEILTQWVWDGARASVFLGSSPRGF